MDRVPRIFIVEDDEDDFRLTADLLCDAYGLSSDPDWAETWEDGLAALSTGGYDAYIVDYRLGARNGLELVREAVSRGCSAPIILLTGEGNHDIDVEAMDAGATDYLDKGRATADQLARAIRYGINQKTIEGRLAAMALEDPLTGLPNRALFSTRLEDAINQAKRGEHAVAVMLLDLDRFKDVNDTFGHPMGDMLLQGVAERLLTQARETDTVARLSGDEFAIIATSLHDEKGATRVAARVVEDLARPFDLDGKEVRISASIGIAMATYDAIEPGQLLSNADIALYQAKDSGGKAFSFFNLEMDAREQAARNLEIELRAGLERGEFSLHFQPIFGIDQRNITAAQALPRWNHPAKGTILPADFIPIAELAGLVRPLGDWVLRQVCAQLCAWRNAGLMDIPVAIRIHDQQLTKGDFVETVSRVIAEFGVSPSMLRMEFSEDEVSQKPRTVGFIIKRLNDIGVRTVISDFGAALSRLNLLADLPIEQLKLDAALVQSIGHGAIAELIVSLGGSLELSVAAQDIETDSDLAFLRRHGCQEGQGDLFSPPLDAEQFAHSYLHSDKKLAARA